AGLAPSRTACRLSTSAKLRYSMIKVSLSDVLPLTIHHSLFNVTLFHKKTGEGNSNGLQRAAAGRPPLQPAYGDVDHHRRQSVFVCSFYHLRWFHHLHWRGRRRHRGDWVDPLFTLGPFPLGGGRRRTRVGRSRRSNGR